MNEETERKLLQDVAEIKTNVTVLKSHAHDPLTCKGLARHEEQHKNIWPIVAGISALCAVGITLLNMLTN